MYRAPGVYEVPSHTEGATPQSEVTSVVQIQSPPGVRTLTRRHVILHSGQE